MQYTIRNIPEALDQSLRDRAKIEGKSLNQVTLQALARGAGFSGGGVRFRELDDLVGFWKEDPEFDLALADQDSVDPELWK